MKRLLCVTICFCVLLFCCSCGAKNSGSTLTNGTYSAEYAEFDTTGWKEYITFTVEDNQVVACEFDAKNNLNEKLSENAAAAEARQAAGMDTPDWYYTTLEEAFTKRINQDGTITQSIAKDNTLFPLLQSAIGAMQKKDTSTQIVAH